MVAPGLPEVRAPEQASKMNPVQNQILYLREQFYNWPILFKNNFLLVINIAYIVAILYLSMIEEYMRQ